MGDRYSKEIDIVDVAKWPARYWVLAFALLIVALSASASLYWRDVNRPPTYLLSLDVFPSGTPARDAAQVAYILAARLPDPTVSGLRVTASFDSRANAETALNELAATEGQIVAEVLALLEATDTYLPENGTALSARLAAQTFLEADSSGLVQLVTSEITEIQPTTQFRSLIMPPIAAVLMFLVLATTHSVWVSMRTRKNLQRDD